ncbi:MAG: M20/M25/M40 family metallo-hydrolase, partial [Hyphomicrobiaceae bacterium]
GARAAAGYLVVPARMKHGGLLLVDGKVGKVKFTAHTDYHPFELKKTLPVVNKAIAGVKAAGMEPDIKVASGGLDANWLTRHGIPTVTFGAGQVSPHTIDEWIDLDQFHNACRLAITLATAQE